MLDTINTALRSETILKIKITIQKFMILLFHRLENVLKIPNIFHYQDQQALAN